MFRTCGAQKDAPSKQGKCSAIETQMIFTRSGENAQLHSDFIVGGSSTVGLDEVEGTEILSLDGVHQAVLARASPLPPRPATEAARASTPGAEDLRKAEVHVASMAAAATSEATDALTMEAPRALPAVATVEGAPPSPASEPNGVGTPWRARGAG